MKFLSPKKFVIDQTLFLWPAAGQPSLQNGHSNGSSTEVKDAATKPPQNVQVIRIISRDSEKKSIQKQVQTKYIHCLKSTVVWYPVEDVFTL